jgi:hypothetical protein
MKRKSPGTTAASSSPIEKSSDSTSAPDYGTKSFWEARYKSHRLWTDNSTNARNGKDENGEAETVDGGGKIVDGVHLSSSAIKAGHAWYFSYEELRPLILPLIIGGDADEVVDATELLEEDGDEGSWVEASDGDDEDDEQGSIDGGEQDHDVEDDEQIDQTSSADDASIDPLEAHLKQQNEEKSTPKLILEIGCGDVPLGSSLTSELNALQSSTGCNARMVVSEVTCIDYSEVVIDSLIKAQKEECNTKEQLKEGKHPLIYPTYTAVDARSLPYPPNTYSLILEKGTLDALLSHPTEGISNSIAVVKEMARVCAVGGHIFIVSHLNAMEDKGRGWLNEVVLGGLKEERMERKTQLEKESKTKEKEILWSIEVHGGDAQNDEECDNGDESDPSYGPAVYIIKKRVVESSIYKEITAKKKKSKGSGDAAEEEGDVTEMPPVKLEFLTYS